MSSPSDRSKNLLTIEKFNEFTLVSESIVDGFAYWTENRCTTLQTMFEQFVQPG